MSKGTKQIRLGRVIRLIDQMEVFLQALKESNKRFEDEHTLGRINQLQADIYLLKSEFQID